MVGTLRRWLAEPRLAGIDVDGAGFVEAHRRILAGKPLTRRVFLELYGGCLDADRRWLSGDGLRIEIGAGSSFFKEVCPGLICTDIKPAPGLHRVVDAMNMPFEPGSVRTIFGIHCFHHLPDPDRFFGELARVVRPGGGCVLIEPYYGPFASAFFRRAFDSEGFDPRQPGWATPSTGPMRGANQALSYIVFVRDAAEFARKHPALEIVERRPLTNWGRYLLSGGVNFRSLAPGWSDPVLRAGEAIVSPLARWLALHHLIVLRRR
jgi:SAM-dependent methyltransferase